MHSRSKPFGAKALTRAALVALASLCATGVGAQTSTVTVPSTPLAVHTVAAPQGEQISEPFGALLSQPITSIHAARLTEDSPSMLGLLFGSAKGAVLPAGTMLFGVQAPDGWIYCTTLTNKSLLAAGEFLACMQDYDRDGRFELARPSGQPFRDVPLMVFQPGPAKRLETPAAYERVPYREGPAYRYEIYWQPVVPKTRKGEIPPLTSQVNIGVRIAGEGFSTPLSGMKTVPVHHGDQRIKVDGAVITIRGLDERGRLVYRIEQAMPPQIQRIEMRLTTSTYYYVCSAC